MAGERRIWEAISRTSARPADPGTMVRDLYGTNRRGGPNTRAAADDLGVSQRQVQRWIRDGVRRASDTFTNLRAGHERYRDSPRGRQDAMNPRRDSRLRNQGTTLKFRGRLKISTDDRLRSTEIRLTGDQMTPILDAALAGDDAAAAAALRRAFSDVFGGSVDLDIVSLETFR